MNKKEWENLKENKCPRCNHILKPTPLRKDIIECTSNNCTFTIYKSNMEGIIESFDFTKEEMVIKMKKRAGLLRVNPKYAARIAAIRDIKKDQDIEG